MIEQYTEVEMVEAKRERMVLAVLWAVARYLCRVIQLEVLDIKIGRASCRERV